MSPVQAASSRTLPYLALDTEDSGQPPVALLDEDAMPEGWETTLFEVWLFDQEDGYLALGGQRLRLERLPKGFRDQAERLGQIGVGLLKTDPQGKGRLDLVEYRPVITS